MTIHIRSQETDDVSDEYGGKFRRIYPWPDVATPPWGSAFMSVAPGSSSIEHSHDEEETFIFLRGEGTMHVDDAQAPVKAGDVVYLPRFSTHKVVNHSDKDVEFLCVWWGAPEQAGAAE